MTQRGALRKDVQHKAARATQEVIALPQKLVQAEARSGNAPRNLARMLSEKANEAGVDEEQLYCRNLARDRPL